MKGLIVLMIVAMGLSFMTASCSEGSGDSDFDGFKHENWKIDSVIDGKVNIQPQTKESEVGILNFRKDGVLNSFVIRGSSSEILPIGTWEYTGDSVIILSEKERLIVGCSYDKENSILMLNGNFQVRSGDKNLRYYLSKYMKPL